VPVYLSSVLQVPIIGRGLRADQKVGIICATEKSLTLSLLRQCGVQDASEVVVVGAIEQHTPEFRKLYDCTGQFNSAKIEKEIVDIATRLVKRHPEVGAILLECSDMPPYAYVVQQATQLPVFDFITLIKWLHNGTTQKPYCGHI